MPDDGMEVLGRAIADSAEDPEALEQLYRADSAAFRGALPQALATRPDAIALRVWAARFAPVAIGPAAAPAKRDAPVLWLVIGLCAVAGSIAKLPSFFGWINAERFYSRNIGFVFLAPLAAYFIARQRLSWRFVSLLAAAFVTAALVINAYPDLPGTPGAGPQSLALALVHLPLFLWTLVGLAFAGRDWQKPETRIGFLRLNGEAIINCALILIAGAIMTGLTITLFSAIQLRIENWYLQWVVICGASAAPIVATHLALARSRRVALAPLLARIFSPLALITLGAYLAAMAVQRRSPFADREFLLVFNVMLVCVLAIAVFCICERQPNRWFDLTILALLGVALIIDVIALSAIVMRLSSYGFSPNRIVTLITNVLVLGNLVAILITFARPAFGRSVAATSTKTWIARFLPIYGAWTAIVVFVLPALFRFR